MDPLTTTHSSLPTTSNLYYLTKQKQKTKKKRASKPSPYENPLLPFRDSSGLHMGVGYLSRAIKLIGSLQFTNTVTLHGNTSPGSTVTSTAIPHILTYGDSAGTFRRLNPLQDCIMGYPYSSRLCVQPSVPIQISVKDLAAAI